MALNERNSKKIPPSEQIVDAVSEILRINKIKPDSQFTLEFAASIVKHMYSIIVNYNEKAYVQDVYLEEDPFKSKISIRSIERALKKQFHFTQITEKESGTRKIQLSR